MNVEVNEFLGGWIARWMNVEVHLCRVDGCRTAVCRVDGCLGTLLDPIHYSHYYPRKVQSIFQHVVVVLFTATWLWNTEQKLSMQSYVQKIRVSSFTFYWVFFCHEHLVLKLMFSFCFSSCSPLCIFVSQCSVLSQLCPVWPCNRGVVRQIYINIWYLHLNNITGQFIHRV